MFWLTVNYRADPLGFPGGKNLTIEEMENAANIDIEPHSGFIYDHPIRGAETVRLQHIPLMGYRKIFSQAVVRAYVKRYINTNTMTTLKQKKVTNTL